MTTRIGIFARLHSSVNVLLMSSIILIAGPTIAVTAVQRLPLPETSQREARLTERRVFVRSKSLLVRGAVVEEKLLRLPEFKQLGFVITRDESDADIVLELRHDLLTKYVFSVVDARSQTVIAGGKLSSLGGTVADKVAKKFVKRMSEAKRG